jgi:hypothetical protein
MMERIKWTERKFDFSQPVSLLPVTLSRLRGTPVRLKHLAETYSPGMLKMKLDEAWSIQEHIGHLLDLEELHEGRIDDFLEGKEILRAADMSNAKTYAASHNDADIQNILEAFRQKRSRFIERLEKLPVEVLSKSALHPRLKVQMRPVDMALFTAEHDEQHFAIIHEIEKKLRS